MLYFIIKDKIKYERRTLYNVYTIHGNIVIENIWKIEEILSTLLEGEVARDEKDNFMFHFIPFCLNFLLIMYMICLYNERLI